LIVTGVLGIVWGAGGTIGSRQNIGHAMFIGAGMLWACYTVAYGTQDWKGFTLLLLPQSGH
jgi:drug/metabolite transporter (DMT)-like permease